MMKKSILLLSLFFTTLFGYEYDELLLKAQANIFPKLILLDKDISKKVLNNQIVFCIVHHASDRIKSENIKSIIEKKFGNKIERYHLKIILKEFDEIKNGSNINAFYILQGPSEKIRKICNIAKRKSIPAFSYDLLNFKEDILISMTIQNSPIIYLNRRVHKEYNIDFVDIFYQIVRFFNE